MRKWNLFGDLFVEMSSWLKGGGNVSAVGERLVVLMKNYSTSERYFPLGGSSLICVFCLPDC